MHRSGDHNRTLEDPISLDIRELRGDLKTVNDCITGLKVAVTTLDGKINALSERVDAKIRAVDDEIKRLEAKSTRVPALTRCS